MLDRQTNPLDIARTVLKPETIHDLKVRGFTNSAYLILDRWALNSPEELKRLEAEGNLAMQIRQDQQQANQIPEALIEKGRMDLDAGILADPQLHPPGQGSLPAESLPIDEIGPPADDLA